jgi:outer membrane protein assembly factor BamE (lipoprotein component of BamABCDE complex)
MRLFAAVVSAFVVSACASNGVVVSDAQAAAFERGKTTEAEVVAMLGQPATVINHNGGHTLMYSGAQAQARPALFIPIVGPLVGGTDARASSVMLRFDIDGKLVDIISSQYASSTAMGVGAMTVTPLEFKP